jgi:hypothetical protein
MLCYAMILCDLDRYRTGSAADFTTVVTLARASEVAAVGITVRLGLGRIVALYHRLVHFIPESLAYSVPLFLKRQCDRTLGATQPGRRIGGVPGDRDLHAIWGGGPLGAAARAGRALRMGREGVSSIHGSAVSIPRLEFHASGLADTDTRPRPTAGGSMRDRCDRFLLPRALPWLGRARPHRLHGPPPPLPPSPGRLGALSVSHSEIGSVWGFCVGAQGA